MVGEILEVLGPGPGGVYCDATVGTAGHARALLDASGPDGRLVGVDRDADALAVAERRLSEFPADRWVLRHGTFSGLGEALRSCGVETCDGILADLGVSSLQLDDPDRGFSFMRDGPLDMRMDRSVPGTALDVLRGSGRNTLERILLEWGDERLAARVASRVHEAARLGRVRSTTDLAREVREAVGRPRSGGVDSATRSFQAIRMAVNREVEELEALLGAVMSLLRPAGVFACLTYHSIEDRLVKRAIRALVRSGEGDLLTRRPIVPSAGEVHANRRARSAKLRAIRRRAG